MSNTVAASTVTASFSTCCTGVFARLTEFVSIVKIFDLAGCTGVAI